MTDLKSRIGSRPSVPKNARNWKKPSSRPGYSAHYYPNISVDFTNTGSRRKKKRNSSPHASCDIPGFEAITDTPTTPTPSNSNSNVAPSTSPSLLSRLDLGSRPYTGGENIDRGVGTAGARLINRISDKVENEAAILPSTADVTMISSVQVEVEDPLIRYVGLEKMDVDMKQCDGMVTDLEPASTITQSGGIGGLDNEPSDVVASPSDDPSQSHPPIVTGPDDRSETDIQPQPDTNLDDAHDLLISDPTHQTIAPPGIDTQSVPEIQPHCLPSPTSEAAVDSLLRTDAEVDDEAMIVCDKPPLEADSPQTQEISLSHIQSQPQQVPQQEPQPWPQLEPQQESQPEPQHESQQESQLQATDGIPSDQPSDSGPTLLSQCRRLLLPLILQNAKSRPDHGGLHTEKVENGAKEVLTDEVCLEFLERAKAVKQDIQNKEAGIKVGDKVGDEESGVSPGVASVNVGGARPIAAQRLDPADPSSSRMPQAQTQPETQLPIIPTPSHKVTPKAPKAMLPSKQTHVLEPVLSGSSSSSIKLPKRPSWNGKSSADGKDYDHDAGVPKKPRKRSRSRSNSMSYSQHDDPSLFPPKPRPPKERWDILQANPMQSELQPIPRSRTPLLPYEDTYPPPQGIPIPMEPSFFAPPPKADALKYRSPSPDRDDYSRRRRRSVSPPHFSPQGTRRPRGSKHWDDPHLSLDRRFISRSPSSSPRRSYSRERRRPRSPPHSPTHTRRQSRRSYSPVERGRPPGSHSRIPHRLPTPTRPRSHYEMHSPIETHRSPSPDSPSHRRRRRRRHRSRHDSYPDTRDTYPSSAGPHKQAHTTIIQSRSRSRSHSHQGRGQPYSSSALEKNQDLDQRPVLMPLQIDPIPQLPSHSDPPKAQYPVPGLWFVKMGLEGADILEFSFDVDSETTMRWGLATDLQCSSTPKAKRKSTRDPRIALHLLCLPTSLVASTYQALEPTNPTPAKIAEAIWGIKTQWPCKGKLVVEVNSKKTCGRTWLPVDLDPASPPVDVTSCIQEGTNLVRFIQLGDLTGYMFILHASLSLGQYSPYLQREGQQLKRQHTNDTNGEVGSPVSELHLAELDKYLESTPVTQHDGAFNFATVVRVS